jgi:hypothetical protein
MKRGVSHPLILIGFAGASRKLRKVCGSGDLRSQI